MGTKVRQDDELLAVLGVVTSQAFSGAQISLLWGAPFSLNIPELEKQLAHARDRYNHVLRAENHKGRHETLGSTEEELARAQQALAEAREDILTFHGSTFECISDSLGAFISSKPYAEIFAEITKGVFDFFE